MAFIVIDIDYANIVIEVYYSCYLNGGGWRSFNKVTTTWVQVSAHLQLNTVMGYLHQQQASSNPGTAS